MRAHHISTSLPCPTIPGDTGSSRHDLGNMLDIVPKCLLVGTSLSPVFGVLAVNGIERGLPWQSWIGWLIAAIVLIGLCWSLLRYTQRNAQKQRFHIKEFERTDHQVLTFLFIYILPFVRSENMTFAAHPVTTVCILGVIVFAIAIADAFHFNPVMRALGYRFYTVKNREGTAKLLISRRDLRRTGVAVQTVSLARDVRIHIGDSGA